MTPEELAEIQKMVVKVAEEVESRLATSLDKAIEGINSKVESTTATASDLQAKAKVTFEALPALIQRQVENQLQDLTKQFEERQKELAGAGDSGGGAGLNLNSLLANSDKIVAVVNAFRSPTTEQAMLSQMNFVMKWHSLLSKLEKGGGSGEEFTKAIASTFTPEKHE